MYLEGKEPTFRDKKKKSSIYLILVLIVLIVFFGTVLSGIAKGEVEPLFLPTPTPTRTTHSYVVEGETHFSSGALDAAIEAYQKAAEMDPTDPEVFTDLARIQTYSSSLLTTDAERAQRLGEALESINRAKELASTDSQVLAVRAFVLDWNANPLLVDADTAEKMLNEAESEAVLALQYDNTNTLALAYYAEILVDQAKWTQAEQYIQQAVERDPNLMDVHRIMAYTYETLGEYNLAIQEYQKAANIMPNLTFLYISIGRIYRHLELYDQALEYFATAANLNTQLGIKDTIPYLAIANTYAQMGEFFPAALNVQQALSMTPANPDVYGQLGVIYHKSRNYEGAIPALECALEGCDAEQSCEVRQCDPETDPMVAVEGLPLSGSTSVYYFTYGSVLSGLHREGYDDYCVTAMDVFNQLREAYPDDETIMSIVLAGEEICTYTDPTPTAEPTTQD
ncbi:MAG: tetratricopeptide repeat protein [Anaerolineaceae bacterium]|jgi:tetratricopeptide (TPR) repeat protein|nr:tetratricopeptide repeat protein [Anaerolineaceae bacterium]